MSSNKIPLRSSFLFSANSKDFEPRIQLGKYKNRKIERNLSHIEYINAGIHFDNK